MIRSVKYLTLLLLLVFSAVIPAQTDDVPSASSGKLQFYLDHASFQGNTDNNHVEFYLMLFADQLKTSESAYGTQAVVDINFLITDLSGNVVDESQWSTEAAINTDSDMRTQVIYDEWSIQLLPGQYAVELNVSDRYSSSIGRIRCNVMIHSLSISESCLSDIKFINGIKREEGGRIIHTPNPSRRYGLLNPTLQFYYEIYSSGLLDGESVIPEYTIEGIGNGYSQALQGSSIVFKEKTVGLIQNIDVKNLNSGSYNLTVSITNENLPNGKVSRAFEILQADYFQTMIMLTDQEFEALESILSVVATESQKSLYEDLSHKGKMQFLVNYFIRDDAVAVRSQNQNLVELLKRYNYAKENFGNQQLDGWSTDMGRVLIMYGFPDEIDRQRFSQDSKPYETWIYRDERELYYVFGDINNNGGFVLLHSNKEGEIYNPSWKDLVSGI
ncbi:MAG: GWxTD domain-containing protein [Melioribacteraceae bacterium]|nr:GWxTD domain-containing protein [Melioribacteraceae bacterium]